MSFVHTVRRALKKLRYPVVDSNGNLNASVTPRVDTLANLLAITDAGDGEVATANDEDALVVYEGDPVTVGQPYYRNGCDMLAFADLGGSSFATGSPTPFTLSSGVSSPASLVDETNDVVLPSPHLQKTASASELLVTIAYSLFIYGLDASANCTLVIEYYDSATSAWLLLTQTAVGAIADSSGILDIKGSVQNSFTSAAAKNITQFRLTFNHDSAAAAGTSLGSVVSVKGQII